MKNKHTGRKTNSSPAQLANMRRFDQMSPEEHRAICRKGGLAGGKKRMEDIKRRNTFKQAVEWAASLNAFHSQNEAVDAILKQYPDLDNTQAMAIAMVKKAVDDGDPRAFTALRDTVGETPQQALSLSNSEPMTINIKTVD